MNIYPSISDLSLSVRSTNVYEEQSLGVFKDDEDEDEDEFEPAGPRVTVWSRYLAMHARKQLAFGTQLICFRFLSNYSSQTCGGWGLPFSWSALSRYSVLLCLDAR